MDQAGRKSSAALATVVSDFPVRFVEPPKDLTEAQAEFWRSVVVSKPIDWFDPGSLPLLASYCRAKIESDRIAGMLDAMSTEWLKDDAGLCRYKELRKLQAQASAELTSLGTKLRLTQQSKYRADAAGTKSKQASGLRPWSQG